MTLSPVMCDALKLAKLRSIATAVTGSRFDKVRGSRLLQEPCDTPGKEIRKSFGLKA